MGVQSLFSRDFDNTAAQPACHTDLSQFLKAMLREDTTFGGSSCLCRICF